ncbi:hypothetical protein TrRE_jg9327 [Triparma retinervis]|uniref:Peptidase M20 dimerisation domain-containing protein n=1 Tax=Triparma retinervis TaxID=2557542 RepID=A0A9W7CJB2_9STRA|nr:hypothetical protein TrRE_jg9327 [Triparma retinervis]
MSKFNKLSLADVEEEGFKPLRKTYSEGGNKTQYSSTKPGSFKFKDPFADFFKYIDYREEIYVQRLREAVAIKSVSAWPDHRPEIMKMMSWCQGWIDKLGGESELYANPLKEQKLDDGTTIPLPPILLGQFGNDPKKKMIYEGMEEYGSEGMFEAVNDLAKPGKFLDDVDFFCISDNYWLGKNKPCLTYGLRGMAYFEVGVECGSQDLHSGVYGGTVHEAMIDLVRLMGSLVDPDGKILVDGVMKDVAEVTEEEEKMYETIDFDPEEYKKECGVATIGKGELLHKTKKDLLMARWRFPTLSLHGIEGAFSDPGAKTVIPRKVMGKFSLRLVPDQNPKQIAEVVTKHLEEEFSKINSPNKMWVKAHHGAKAWLSSTDHPNYEAAKSAVKTVFGQTPDMTREGGSIPIATWLEDATQMNVLLLPVGACDDMAHSQNEKFNKANMMNAIKVLGVYLHEVAKIKGPKPSDCKCEPLSMEEMMIPGAFARGFRCKCEI